MFMHYRCAKDCTPIILASKTKDAQFHYYIIVMGDLKIK